MISLIALGLGAITLATDASSLVAAEVIRAGDRVSASNATAEGEVADSNDPLLGREVRRTIYVGQAITADNTRPPMLVKRNQVVSIRYVRGPLEITTIGRAMGEAGANETVTVLNQDSRQLVQGIVQEEGWVLAQ
ncbi:flagellar basal body P-ring formation chaperone FlgA [Hyphomonas sp.]|uniref:flagellar basal body P-ring formation chaperone FlgA n=1 Tax=Hyphomonas sp. TaxID=87 RepID=UPI0032EBE2CD|tara:strand:- start:55900 stop:56304 length:405 start_codon:yes stop_codon:yes gene_type:complete